MRRLLRSTMAALALVTSFAQPSAASDGGGKLSNEQLFTLLFVDQGRSFGYQTMMARIQVDTVKAELERDRALLDQNEKLFQRKAIPLIQLELSKLKDAWNRKQLIVAEKSLAYVSAEREAMTQMANYFAGAPASIDTLYAAFLRGWEAGCDKGPDEVVAMQAWLAYAEKSLERAQELNRRGSLPQSAVLERKAQVDIARSNYSNREAGLAKCRTVLFPSLEQVKAIGR
ncbi:MAG: hypothetical protein U1E30_09810 [Rhodoblastus sp.]